jgi:TonB family protein
MARKYTDNQTEPTLRGKPGAESRRDELDKIVTEELTQALRRGGDVDQGVEPGGLEIIDTQLRAHVESLNDDGLKPGVVLKDRFEIVALIHSGGMGHVYKAIDRRRNVEGSGGVHVAIKMMRPKIASLQDARVSLEQEAAKAQALAHPNIINIFDFDEHDGQFFLVMEWLEGESLTAVLRRAANETLEPSVAWSIVEGVATAVQHAHANNIVHADINPSNIFVTENQGVKLLDFGVARVAGDTDELVDDQIAWVTQTYSSPEVLSGLAPVFEDDIFSLGCVAYRLLSGAHPFGGAPSLVAQRNGITVEPIPWLNADDWHVLNRSLSYERAQRPSDVADFVARAGRSLREPDVIGRPKGGVLLQWRLLWIAAAAVASAGLGWQLLQPGGGDVASPVVEAPAPEPFLAEVPSKPLVLSPVPELVVVAATAFEQGQFITPAQDSARAIYREILALEPGNKDALYGLRAISDYYLQQARTALNGDDPAQAYVALEVATETDPENPAVGLVRQLLTAKGNSELADARLAAAAGNFDLVQERLARAERYDNVDDSALQAIRDQVARKSVDDQLLASLAAADAHMAAGRLIAPDADNAHELLLELHAANGDDPRLLASMERLGDRLLTRAMFFGSAARVDEATTLLDAVDALGVLAPEVELARISLVDVSESTVSGGPSEPGLAPVDDAAQVPAETNSDREAELLTGDSQAIRRSVQEFGIDTYVAPVYPGRAIRRGITGTVDVRFRINPDGSTDSIEIIDAEPGEIFSESALDAVRQWRFDARAKEVWAQITLRFDLAE